MRTFAALLLPSLVVLAGCATRMDASCELAVVPADAVPGVRQGADTATYPAQIPPGLTGCQRIWYGDRQRPEAMQVLATYHFERGQVRRLVGKVPDGPAYDCHYRDGQLQVAASQNPGQCPAAPAGR